jgi:hypothetical protein
MQNLSIEELNEQYIEVVKLCWKFPTAYNLTLKNLQVEFLRRGILPPIVENPLEYLTQPN